MCFYLIFYNKCFSSSFQIFTGVCSVEETYRRNLRGDPKPTKQQQQLKEMLKESGKSIDFQKKFKFSSKILNDLYLAGKHFYSEMDEANIKREANISVATKLNQIHNHFNYLLKKSENKSELKSYDDIGFLNYQKYKNNSESFKELDEKLGNLLIYYLKKKYFLFFLFFFK